MWPLKVHGLSFGKVLRCFYEYPDLALDLVFSELDVLVQLLPIDVAHDEQVDEAGVLAAGVVIEDIDCFDVSQLFFNVFYDLIYAQGFFDDGMDLGKEGMLGVSPKEYGAAVLLLGQVPGPAQAVQLGLDGAWGHLELGSQLPEVAGDVGIQKELKEQLNAGFGGKEFA